MVDVSILFFDVRDFTQFAADGRARRRSSPSSTRSSSSTVPIIARHGGHVDKFVGDGLMASSARPETFPDHAERAVRAALEIDRWSTGERAGGVRIGLGLNTGRVVAGSIGGGGPPQLLRHRRRRQRRFAGRGGNARNRGRPPDHRATGERLSEAFELESAASASSRASRRRSSSSPRRSPSPPARARRGAPSGPGLRRDRPQRGPRPRPSRRPRTALAGYGRVSPRSGSTPACAAAGFRRRASWPRANRPWRGCGNTSGSGPRAGSPRARPHSGDRAPAWGTMC